MTFSCNFVMEHDPVAKQRPRFERGHVRTPEKTKAFETAVTLEALAAMRGADAFEGPVCVKIRLWVPMPPSWSKKKREAMAGTLHTQRPDADNYVKALLDGMNGVVFRDDAQAAKLDVEKRWGPRGRIGVMVEAAA